MKKNFYFLFALLLFAGAVHAQTNEVATPLFSADVKDVVSMYCDENAETFYLHTESTKYVVSKEGEVLSEEPSKPLWACWEDGVMYTHAEGEQCILNQKGDTIVNIENARSAYYLTVAKPMCYKDGVFYWWSWAGISSKSTGFYSFNKDKEMPSYIMTCLSQCVGLVVMDNNRVLCTFNVEDGAVYSLFFNNERGWDWESNFQDLFGLKAVVGLALVENSFYVWSDDTQTMYTFPKSYFGGVTGVQTPIIEAEKEFSGFFTLDGRPVDGTQKGILIRNGKKVLVK